MPVLGHAFAGWAAALAIPPHTGSPRAAVNTALGQPASAPAGPAWVAILVVLAYLPDIASQLLLVGGFAWGRLAGHSLVVGAVAASLLGLAIGRAFRISWRRAGLVVLASLAAHDILDLLQATDRAPFWPLVGRPVGLGLHLVPVGGLEEAALFGGLFLLLVLVRRRPGLQSRCRAGLQSRRKDGASAPSPTWPWRLATVAVIAAALVTHLLRDERQRDLERARQLLERRDWAGALAAADRAGRWPSSAHPGRIEYVRAEAHAGMGRRSLAEREYAKSLAADPAYFWALADLAVCIASADNPMEVRRQRLAPYLARLRSDFAAHPQLPATLTRIGRALARSPENPD